MSIKDTLVPGQSSDDSPDARFRQAAYARLRKAEDACEAIVRTLLSNDPLADAETRGMIAYAEEAENRLAELRLFLAASLLPAALTQS